jgi:ATP-dependent Lhr-like helicase
MIQPALDWFAEQKWKPFDFQVQAWNAYLAGKSGLVNAPTGSGKTYSLLTPILLEYLRDHPNKPKNIGLQAIWITPIRALSKEIEYSAQRATEALQVPWQIGVRTGDTSLTKRARQKTRPPEFLITTPESLHLLLASRGYDEYFKDLRAIVVDEWHELMGSKRGVQVELALSRLKNIAKGMKVWGISATIGNMDQALEVLMGSDYRTKGIEIIRAKIKKEMEVESVLPDELERMPWSGHLGIHMLKKVLPIIHNSTSTLLFTNVRSGAEIWYQKLLDAAPELAGVMAMHHSAISQQLRSWVEEQLHEGNLKAVVCTSSLDLGVDFRPVETVIQVGSPKGVARFLQRGGRSGHQPGAVSRIFFLPTNSLELIEASALREAMNRGIIEERIPYVRSFDVLIQYLITLAVSNGFRPKEIYEEIRNTFSYNSVTEDEFNWLLRFITTGGHSLTAYDEYRKVEVEDGVYKVVDRRIAQRHRLSIGTIVGDSSVLIKFVTGKYIGSIEEYFIAQLNPGDVFWFAGRTLELVRVKDMEAQVRKSNKKSGRVPSWQGGRMPLSSLLSDMIRLKVDEAANNHWGDPEMKFIKPLMELQRKLSHLPKHNEFLVESFESSEGHHVMMYPFEGRNVHEGMAALVAYRISKIRPITFSIAMNDYGFELLSDQEIPIYEAIETDLLGSDNLRLDIQASINSTEMARRKFRDIAAISGLVFKGYPGKPVKDRHLQSNSQLFFDVFHQYESTNLLLLQAYEEVMDFQLEETRLRRALDRIAKQKIIVKEPDRPTPFSFPIIVDGMREKLTSEKLEDRIKKMLVDFEEG